MSAEKNAMERDIELEPTEAEDVSGGVHIKNPARSSVSPMDRSAKVSARGTSAGAAEGGDRSPATAGASAGGASVSVRVNKRRPQA